MKEAMGASALILEGGSLRCLFTAGVLDVLMEEGVDFSCVGGVSAGALCGINFLSRQPGRVRRINLEYVGDKRYMGFRNLLCTGSVFNFDFLFNEITDELIPLDRTAFETAPHRFAAFSTDCRSGELVVHEKGKCEDIFLATRASASMPLLAPMVDIDGRRCIDGGMAMAAPVDWAIEEGYEKIVVVLTRNEDYRKKPTGSVLRRVYQRVYRHYPKLVERLISFPEQYNALYDHIRELEAAGRIFVLRPQEPVTVSKTEKDIKKLEDLYQKGRVEATRRLQALQAYLGEPPIGI